MCIIGIQSRLVPLRLCSSRSFASRLFASRSFTTKSFATKSFTSRSFAPISLAPRSLASGLITSRSFSSTSIVHGRLVTMLESSHELCQIVSQKNRTSHLKNFLGTIINPNAYANVNKLSLIELAAKNGCTENIKLLLSHGANMDNALYFAALSGFPDSIKTIEILIQAGANLNTTYNNLTALEQIDIEISNRMKQVRDHNKKINENDIEDLKKARSFLLKITDWDRITEIIDTKKVNLFPKLL